MMRMRMRMRMMRMRMMRMRLWLGKGSFTRLWSLESLPSLNPGFTRTCTLQCNYMTPPHEIRKNFVQKIHAPFFKIDHLLLPRYKESTEKMGYVMGKTKEQFTLRVVMYRL